MEQKFRIGDSKVLESRETVDGTMIRRRRESADGRRFTTYERVEMPPLTVTKRSGNKAIFDRDKLLLAVKRSVGKFFNSELEIASDILYAYGTDQITSKQIGEAVLDVLAEINEVAYVRFASVFREFKTLEDFENILKEQKGKYRGAESSDSHRRVTATEGDPKMFAKQNFGEGESPAGPAEKGPVGRVK